MNFERKVFYGVEKRLKKIGKNSTAEWELQCATCGKVYADWRMMIGYKRVTHEVEKAKKMQKEGRGDEGKGNGKIDGKGEWKIEGERVWKDKGILKDGICGDDATQRSLFFRSALEWKRSCCWENVS